MSNSIKSIWYLIVEGEIVNKFYDTEEAKDAYEESIGMDSQYDKVELVRVIATTKCNEEKVFHGANGYLQLDENK